MSKSPQGVYVNEAEHNRATRLVDNALDGHGNLSGFIDFIEQSLFRAANAQIDDLSWNHGAEPVQTLSRYAQTAFRDDFNNDYDDPPSARLEEYEQQWRKTLDHLPWASRDGRDSAFALFIHRHQARIWAQDHVAPGDREPQAFRSVADALRSLKALRKADDSQPPGATSNTPDRLLGTPIWQGNNLEVLLTPAKSKSTSFYLNPEAHALTLKIFGREFFSWIERSLLRLLDDPNHWLLLEPELRFLEHGSALIDYQHAYWDERDANDLKRELKEFVENDPDWDENEEPTLDIWRAKAQFYPVFNLRTDGGFSWYAAQEEGVGAQPQHRLGAFQDSLILAYRLGLTSLLQEIDTETLKAQLLPAFMEAYKLDRIAPERRLAYHVLKTNEIPTLPTYVNNAIDYHVMKLFQQYALSVLPQAEQEPTRVHPAVLATLSQPWVFPTRTTLETYANTAVTKAATGQWQITKGKTTHLTLTDEEAYWTAKTLNAIFSTQPIRTTYFTDMNPEEEFYEWTSEETKAKKTLNHIAWREALQVVSPTTTRLRYKLAPELIRRARDQITRNGPAIAPTTPISAGALLTAELTDETLQASGRFLSEFKSKSIHDFSDFQLEPAQLSTLTTLLKQFLKHTVTNFHRTKTIVQRKPWPWSRNETYYSWAYHHDDAEYTLGSTYDESIKEIALAYANYPEEDYAGPFNWALRQSGRWQENELHSHLVTIAQTPDDQRSYTMPRIDDPQFNPVPIVQAVMRYYRVLDAAGAQSE